MLPSLARAMDRPIGNDIRQHLSAQYWKIVPDVWLPRRVMAIEDAVNSQRGSTCRNSVIVSRCR